MDYLVGISICIFIWCRAAAQRRECLVASPHGKAKREAKHLRLKSALGIDLFIIPASFTCLSNPCLW